MFQSPLFRNRLALTFIALPWITGAYAQSEWDNGAGTGAWATGTNWVGKVTPPANADLLFSNAGGLLTANQTVNLGANTVVNSLTYDSKLAYILTGPGSGTTYTLTFGDGTAPAPSITINDNTPNGGSGPKANHDINNNVTIAELLTITNNSVDNLTFNGNLTNNAGMVIDGPGAVSIDSASYSGAGSITKNGSGTLFLRKSTGPAHNTTVNAGILSIDSSNALDDTPSSTVTIASGASMEISNATTTSSVINVSGNGVNYGTQGNIGAIFGAPGPKGTNYLVQMPVNMTANTSFGAFEGVTLTFGSSTIKDNGGAYSFTKVGEGAVILNNSASNLWTGDTIIKEGLLGALTDMNSLPGGYTTPGTGKNPGRLVLDGGVFGVVNNSTTPFTRSVGSGANQINWAGDGGFAGLASGGISTVNLGDAAAALTWGSGGFVPDGKTLIFGHELAPGAVNFLNPITLGSTQREIKTVAGTISQTGSYWDATAVLSGALTGTNGFRKTGDGVLALAGTNTGLSGPITISEGALSLWGGTDVKGTLGSANLVLDGGVYMVTGDAQQSTQTTTYAPSLGTAAGNVSWSGNGGGFAGYANTSPTITLNNDATTPLVWGTTANFLHNGETLTLGSALSRNTTVTLNNAIDLGGAARTIRINDSKASSNPPATTYEAVLPQVLSNGSLNIVGDGAIALRAVNTLAGAIDVKGANLILDNAGTLNSASSFTVSQGGAISLNNIQDNEIERLNNSAPLTLNGGAINIQSFDGNPVFTETIGALNLTGGANDLTFSGTSSNGNFNRLNASSLNRSGNATMNFQGTIYFGTEDTYSPQVKFTTTPTLTNGVIPYATVNGTDFAGYGTYGIVAATSAFTPATDQSSWTSSVNYRGGGQTLNANRTVNSLALTSGSTVSGAFGLTVNSGGIVTSGADVSSITTNTIKSGNGELITHVNNPDVSYVYPTITPALTISSSIQDATGGPSTLVKTGPGTLALTGTTANTLTGGTVVQEGVLALNKTAGVTAISGNITVGDRAGTDTLRLDASEQIADTSTVTLKSGDQATGSSTLLFNGLTTTSGNYTGQSGVSETFHELKIDGPSTLDLAGGLNDAPNYLFLDVLTMADSTSSLNVKNWESYKDFLLVKDPSNFASIAPQIKFDGYEGTPIITKYNADYWQIAPFANAPVVPEPGSCGLALLGLGGLGGACGRRRRRRPKG